MDNCTYTCESCLHFILMDGNIGHCTRYAHYIEKDNDCISYQDRVAEDFMCDLMCGGIEPDV